MRTRPTPLPDSALCETLQTAIRLDHAGLADLIDRVSQICPQPPASDCHANGCDTAKIQACDRQCADLGESMLQLMLDHFEREDQLMHMLPQTGPASSHCDAHRLAHIDFSCRYNRLVAGEYQDCALLRIQALQSFLHDWTVVHALAYDDELARQLHAATRF